MAHKRIDPNTPQGKLITFIWTCLPYALLIGFIIILFLLGGVIGEKKNKLEEEKKAALAQEKKPINAILLTLHPTAIRDRINLPGIIEAWTDLELLAKINGSVEEVLVREGDMVQQGQILARLEETDYVLVRNAAQAAHNLAMANCRRSETLHEKGLLPTAELDVAKTELETTKSALSDAELNLARCTIKAPITGVIERLDAKVGLLLAVSDPIAKILEVDRVKAVIGIPESDVAAVGNLDEVDVTLQALGDRRVTGKKHFLSTSSQSVARLYQLELALDNTDHSILPGMFVRAELVKRMVQKTVSVPVYSVVTRNDEQYVFIAEDGKAVKKSVSLGIMEGWRVQLTEGVNFGEQILVEGHRDVESGDTIKVIRVIDDQSELP